MRAQEDRSSEMHGEFKDVSKIQWIKYVIYVYTVDKFEERKYTVLLV